MLNKDKEYQLKFDMHRVRLAEARGRRVAPCYEDDGYEAWDVQEIVIQCIHDTQEHRPRGGCGKPKPF